MERDNPEAINNKRFLRQIAVRDGGRALVRNIPEPLRLQFKKATKRSVILVLEVITGVLVLGLVGLYYLNVRLDKEPISFQFAVEPIQIAINRELKGLSVKIENAIIAKDKNNTGIRFLLQNVHLYNNEGVAVAKAPFASVGLSGRALLSGKLAAGSVDLIGSTILLHYRRNEGISFSFPETRNNSEAHNTALSLPLRKSGDSGNSQGSQLANTNNNFDPLRGLAASISKSISLVRTSNSGSSYLSRFGLEDTSLIVDYDGNRSSWTLPSAGFSLTHESSASVAEGRIRVESSKGVWEIGGRIEGGAAEKPLLITAGIKNFTPSSLHQNFWDASFLRAFHLPLSGKVSLSVDNRGIVTSAEGKLRAAAGHVVIPGRAGGGLLVRGGELNLKYDPATERIVVLPSPFKWDGGRAILQGAVSSAVNQQDQKVWVFSLETADAVLESQNSGTAPLAVETWKLDGIFAPAISQVQIDRYQVGIGETSLNLNGYCVNRDGRLEFGFDGQVSPMPVSQLIRIWPEALAAGPWSRIKKSVIHGRFEGGKFKIQGNGATEYNPNNDAGRLVMHIDAAFSDLAIRMAADSPTLQIPKVKIFTDGTSLSIDMPDGHFFLPSGRLVNLTDGSFRVNNLAQEDPVGILQLKMKNSAAAIIELANQNPINLLRKSKLDLDALEGETIGSLTLKLPLQHPYQLKNISVKSDFRLDRIRFGKVLGGIQIQGGRINFKITEKSILAQGDIICNGVPANLNFQRNFGEADARQPPIQISGTFDDSARDQLGIKINRFVEGAIPATITFDPGAPLERRLKFEGNLTQSAIFLDQVPWQKDRGRQAHISFNIVKGTGGKTELRQFKLVGDNINFDGRMVLDADKKMIQYDFEDFSFDGQNKIRIAGLKSRDGVWNVKVQGSSFNGRPTFRKLFLTGREDKLIRGRWRKKKIDMDLRAEIDRVIGYSGADVRSISLSMKKRDGKLSGLNLQGTLDNDAPIAARLVKQNRQGRIILAETDNAGSAFRLIGMYPSAQGGQASMRVFLDKKGDAEKSGTLWARNFYILGDPVVQEVLNSAGNNAIGEAYPQYQSGAGRKKQIVRQKLLFQQLEIPFSVGHGQFIMHDSILNGPLLGATMRGRIDFENRYIDLGGTYVPLYGLNSAVGVLPIIGEILTGRRGEGLLGITFGVKGNMSRPEVLVNPMSMVAPGIFRQMFEFSQPSPRLIPRN